MENEQKPNAELKRVTLMRAMNLAFEFGFIIALPIIALGLLGKYLDKKFGTSYIVLIAILLAIGSSTVWISKRIKSILEELKKK